jgi:catechol 2,3-dioxygenase-like lactoylglutathione lyase family enzyme
VAIKPPIKFDHCVIHVSEWERSSDFYARVFGMEVIKRGKGYAFRLGDIQLNCHGPGFATDTVWPACLCSRETAISASSGLVRSMARLRI